MKQNIKKSNDEYKLPRPQLDHTWVISAALETGKMLKFNLTLKRFYARQQQNASSFLAIA